MTEKIQETEIKKTRLRLSERLKLVASFVPEGSRIADIGTDHGYVPIYLAEIGKITGQRSRYSYHCGNGR